MMMGVHESGEEEVWCFRESAACDFFFASEV
jgi:hypothetical protein